MKNLIIIIFILIASSNSGTGQSKTEWIQGKISFVTKKNIYVKFNDTKFINADDSIFIKSGNNFYPVLSIAKKSSVSILCSPLNDNTTAFNKGQIVYAKIKKAAITPKENDIVKSSKSESVKKTGIDKNEKKDKKALSKIKGKFTLATNSNLANIQDKTGYHRFRYIFSMEGANLVNSKFYFDNYIVFNQTLESDFTHSDKFNDKFRAYRVNLGYKTGNFDISVGRQIKNKISALGSFDGIYVETKVKNDFYSGIIVGSRPDYTDYGFNSQLFQYGTFISYFPSYKKSSTRGTIAIFEQKNNGNIDRRFVYLQFSMGLTKKIRFFGASEIDLYHIAGGIANNDPKITSIYGNLAFRITKKLNLSLGVDSRKNRIYYETFKDYLETIIDRETRQGLRLRGSYRPFRKVSFSLMSNFRFQDKTIYSSYYNSTIYLRSLPVIKSDISLSGGMINTNYLNNKSLTVRFSKRIKKRIQLRLEYKYYRYFYPGTNITRIQNRIGGSLNINIAKRLYLSIYYEKTLQKYNTYSRLNLRATKRFRFKN